MPRDEPALVERDGELTSLVTALSQAPAMTVIEGEPGIGKTLLVRRALGDPALTGRAHLVGSARPTLKACPLGPVIEALATVTRPPVHRLSALSGVLRAVLPDLADLLPPAPPPLVEPHLMRHRLVRATVELLSKLGPSILVVEDLQWADDATLELLRMIRTQPPPDVSVVVTCRSPMVLPGPATAQIRLAPLPESAARRVAAETLGDPETSLPPDLAGMLYERSGGVPLAVREDALLLRERGLLRAVNGEWTLEPRADPATVIPPAVGAEIVARARALGTAGRSALEAAAVLGEPAGRGRRSGTTGPGAASGPTDSSAAGPAIAAGAAEPDLVALVAGLDAEQVWSGIGDASRSGLLRDHDPGGAAVRFRHELARLAVYQSIPRHRRRGMHAVAAKEMVGTGRADLLMRAVEHHRRAGDPAGWAASAEAAADLAAAGGAFGTAHAYLSEVLHADAVPAGRRAEVAIKLGWTALGDAGRTDATTALLVTAERGDAASPVQRAELRLLRAWCAVDAGRPRQETDAALDAMCGALDDLDARPDLTAIAFALLATPNRLPERGVTTQSAFLDRARAALTRTADPMAHTVVRATAAHLLLASGSPDGRAAADALVARGDRPDVRRQLVLGLITAADAAAHLGHYARGLELLERGRRLAPEGAAGAYDALLRTATLRIRWITGDGQSARDGHAGPNPARHPVRRGTEHAAHPAAGATPGSAAVDTAKAFAALADDPGTEGRLPARLLAALVRTGQGRLDVARRMLGAVTEEACRIGDLAVAAHAVAELNRVALTVGQRRQGHGFARQVLDGLHHKQIWVWAAPLLPFVPLDLVRGVLPEYRRALAGRDAPLARAALGFAEARVYEQDGDAERASAGYRRARRRYAALPDPRMAAHACAGEVRAQLSAGLAPDAESLRHAWNTLTRLGAAWDADRMTRLMRAAGLPVPRRRGRPGYGNQLSPREREIAGLAASGHTNRDIAASLFLSDRTVKFHLANAMRKLEVSSRRRLRDVLEPVTAASAVSPVAGAHTCRCEQCGRELNPS